MFTIYERTIVHMNEHTVSVTACMRAAQNQASQNHITSPGRACNILTVCGVIEKPHPGKGVIFFQGFGS